MKNFRLRITLWFILGITVQYFYTVSDVVLFSLFVFLLEGVTTYDYIIKTIWVNNFTTSFKLMVIMEKLGVTEEDSTFVLENKIDEKTISIFEKYTQELDIKNKN